jgi:hypothetical protein
MTTTIAPQPEYASRSTALSSVWDMVSNRSSGELIKGIRQFLLHLIEVRKSIARRTVLADLAPIVPRPYRIASRMQSRSRQSPTSSTTSSVDPVQVRMGSAAIKIRSYLRPVDTPDQIRARNERLIPPLCFFPTCSTLSFASFRTLHRRRRRLSSTRHRYRLQSRHDGLDKVGSEPTLIQSGGDEVCERDGRDLAFFFNRVHIHAEAELVVATGYISMT